MRWLPLLVLLGCQTEEAVDPLCDVAEPLTYETWGKGFIDTHCVGCHSSIIPPAQRRDAPAGIDFDTYRGILQWSERIEARALTDARAEDDTVVIMPPGGGPTPEELDMLEEWLYCGVYHDKQLLESE